MITLSGPYSDRLRLSEHAAAITNRSPSDDDDHLPKRSFLNGPAKRPDPSIHGLETTRGRADARVENDRGNDRSSSQAWHRIGSLYSLRDRTAVGETLPSQEDNMFSRDEERLSWRKVVTSSRVSL